jgi:hypothetical protein
LVALGPRHSLRSSLVCPRHRERAGSPHTKLPAPPGCLRRNIARQARIPYLRPQGTIFRLGLLRAARLRCAARNRMGTQCAAEKETTKTAATSPGTPRRGRSQNSATHGILAARTFMRCESSHPLTLGRQSSSSATAYDARGLRAPHFLGPTARRKTAFQALP